MLPFSTATPNASAFQPIFGLLDSVWHVLLAAAPSLMGLAILIVAFTYLTAGSDERKAHAAKKQAIRVAVGIAMYGSYGAFEHLVLDLGEWMGQGFGSG